MNRDDAVKLCRYVKACCPQQAIDEYTPDAWADHLEHVTYDDAKAAVREITAKQAFVNVAEVLTIVKRIRAKRIAEAGDLCPPPGLTGTEERAWIGEARVRIANGETVSPNMGELKARHLPDLRALMPKPDGPPAWKVAAAERDQVRQAKAAERAAAREADRKARAGKSEEGAA